MKKIAFVAPWYGDNISGGAEMELRGLVTHLQLAGVDLEVLTTCVKDFNSDWNVNYYKSGIEVVSGIHVRRFIVRKRNTECFDKINYKLMNNIAITDEEEKSYIAEMINSPQLYHYIKNRINNYSLFVFIPYMFGTTYYGSLVCKEKAVLIPCFHDESYLYLKIYKEAYSTIRGMIFHATQEQVLAGKIFNLCNIEHEVLGEGVDTNWNSDEDDFRKKYNVDYPYILYAGRKDKGKNIDLLIKYFKIYKKRNKNMLKLILIGGGFVEIPKEYAKDIIDMGYLETQDKYNAYSGSLCLCQPSLNESFSLVVMESWLSDRPVLVHGKCPVTREFVIEAKGGLFFENYPDFEGCIEYFLNNITIAKEMGKLGKNYVMKNFSWDCIVKKYVDFFDRCISTVSS